MPNNSKNVTTGKPKVGGAIYRAPAGSPLPSSATDELDEAYKALGYASEDGVSNANEREAEELKAWGGDTVMSAQTNFADSFTVKLIESMNIDVLKSVYGEENVTGTSISEGISVNVNSEEQEEAIWIIDMMLRGNVPKRIVIPNGKISETEEIVYKDNELVGYGITITALPDESNNTHMEYIGGSV